MRQPLDSNQHSESSHGEGPEVPLKPRDLNHIWRNFNQTNKEERLKIEIQTHTHTHIYIVVPSAQKPPL